MFCFVFLSCAHINMERRVKIDSGAGKQESVGKNVVTIPIETEPVEVAQPVYIPDKSPLPAKPSGTEVAEKVMRNVLKPQNYSHSAVIYDYGRDWVYEVYCQPLRASDIQLKPGERAMEEPFISDSERWLLGAGVSYEDGIEAQHIYIKPVEANLSASLIINTNERVYHLILRSYSDKHMPKVRWKYNDKPMPKNYIQSIEAKEKEKFTQDDNFMNLADPRFLSFNYKVTYAIFRKPRWIPALVYDDGKKTYITFPEEALRHELPVVFENRDEIVNYRVARNVIIMDKLVERITIKIGKRKISVIKKKSN